MPDALGLGTRVQERSVFDVLIVPESLHHFLKTITDKFELAKSEVLNPTGQSNLLINQPLLARTLKVRDAYLATLHQLQVNLLERVHTSGETTDPLLRRALPLTINGLAAWLVTLDDTLETSDLYTLSR